MLKYYKIPAENHYVQTMDPFNTWEQVAKVDYNTPTVILLTDSLATHYKRFVVVYKDKMQIQGGSGSCYNPARKTFIYKEDPMDNSIMPAHMSKWTVFNMFRIYQMCATVKANILQNVSKGNGEEFYTYLGLYNTVLHMENPMLLNALLDLVGMRKISPEILRNLPKAYGRKQLLLKA